MALTVKLHTHFSTLISLLAYFLVTLASATTFAGTTNSSQHATDDSYWADLAQDYSPFVAPQMAARTAARGEDIAGQWGSVIAWPHIPVSAANLPDGCILTYSASGQTSFPGGREYSYSSTLEPSSNAFFETPNNSHDMFCAYLSTLEDGQIFLTGGRNYVKTTHRFCFVTS